MILAADDVRGDCVTRIPVWKLCWPRCWANARIVFTPIDCSVQNSIQMVPHWARGSGVAAVGRGVYFWIIAVVGLKEVVIFLRLWAQSAIECAGGCSGQSILRRATGVCKSFPKFVKGYADFLL